MAAARGLRLIAARRATASLRDSRFSRASFARSEVFELLRSARDFCRLGVLLTANDVAPFKKSIQTKVRAIVSLGIKLQLSFQCERDDYWPTLLLLDSVREKRLD